MSFLPVAPMPGIAGWRFLERTETQQRAAFARDAALQRDVAYFKDRIGEASTAHALVSDPRLLRVALGAFGLEEDAGKQALLRRVLEEGVADPRSFANRLVDPRYRRFAAAFGYGDGGAPGVADPRFADRIAAKFEVRRFEAAVGDADPDLRLALNFRREVRALVEATEADGARWFAAMGDKPVRAVFESAFGLPKEFGTLDVDRQRQVLRDKSRALFGSGEFGALAASENLDALLRRFFARRAAESGPNPTTPGAAALALLGGRGIGAGGASALLLSAAAPR